MGETERTKYPGSGEKSRHVLTRRCCACVPTNPDSNNGNYFVNADENNKNNDDENDNDNDNGNDNDNIIITKMKMMLK